MVSHVRHCVDLKKSKSIYQPIFESQLFFCCADFDKKISKSVQEVSKKYLRLIHFRVGELAQVSYFKLLYINEIKSLVKNACLGINQTLSYYLCNLVSAFL